MKQKLTTRSIIALKPLERPYEVRDADLQGLLLRVQPTGTMTFYCDLRGRDGRRNRVKIGRSDVVTLAQARDEARKVLGDVARGIDPSIERKRLRTATLRQFIDQKYETWAAAHRKRGGENIERMRRQFSEFLGDSLSEVSAWKVEKWRAARLKRGTSAATVNRNIAILKAALSKAVEWDILPSNPLSKVRPLKVDTLATPRFLSDEEDEALRNALDERNRALKRGRLRGNNWRSERGYAFLPDLTGKAFADHLKPMVLLSLNTGLRQGEVFQLRWSQVDLLRKQITVSGDRAKSGKTRHVPLNSEALEVLVSWKQQQESETDLVFPGKNGLKKFDNIKRSWGGVLKRAGIKKFRWHDLRHTFASRLVMVGVDLNIVRELLGHSDIKMTLRYAHLAPHVKAEAVSRLDKVSVVAPSFQKTVVQG